MAFPERQCRECGNVFKARHRTSLFCSPACKQRFHNRRRERGAELYDFLMAGGEPGRAIATNLLDAYRVADKAARAGRPSFVDTEMAMTRIPFAYGKAGDGR